MVLLLIFDIFFAMYSKTGWGLARPTSTRGRGLRGGGIRRG